jgi:hypothetical protein
LILQNAQVTGFESSSETDGIVAVASGTVDLGNGAKFTGNTGILIKADGTGTVNLKAGSEISGNTVNNTTTSTLIWAYTGGTVNLEAASATLAGPVISGNTLGGAAKGVIYIDGGTVNLKGGTIKGNKASSDSAVAAGIYLSDTSNSALNVEGEASVTGNTIPKTAGSSSSGSGGSNSSGGSAGANTSGVQTLGVQTADTGDSEKNANIVLAKSKTMTLTNLLTGSLGVTSLDEPADGVLTTDVKIATTTGLLGKTYALSGESAISHDGSLYSAQTVTASTTDYYLKWSDSIYVSSTGDDTNGTGSRENPYKTLAKAMEAANSKSGGTIYVMDDLTENFTSELTQGANVVNIQKDPEATTIPTVTVTGRTGSLFTVNGGTLVIKDIVFDGSSDNTSTTTDSPFDVTGGQLALESGAKITGFSGATNGGAIQLGGTGLLLLSGGEITGNTATDLGGGIYSSGSSSQLVVTGGTTIKNNLAGITGKAADNASSAGKAGANNLYSTAATGSAILTVVGDLTGEILLGNGESVDASTSSDLESKHIANARDISASGLHQGSGGTSSIVGATGTATDTFKGITSIKSDAYPTVLEAAYDSGTTGNIIWSANTIEVTVTNEMVGDYTDHTKGIDFLAAIFVKNEATGEYEPWVGGKVSKTKYDADGTLMKDDPNTRAADGDENDKYALNDKGMMIEGYVNGELVDDDFTLCDGQKLVLGNIPADSKVQIFVRGSSADGSYDVDGYSFTWAATVTGGTIEESAYASLQSNNYMAADAVTSATILEGLVTDGYVTNRKNITVAIRTQYDQSPDTGLSLKGSKGKALAITITLVVLLILGLVFLKARPGRKEEEGEV